MIHRAGLLATSLLIGSIAIPVAAQLPDDAVLVFDQAAAAVEHGDQGKVDIRGLVGDVGVRLGKPGEIRFDVRNLDDRGVEQPVGLWRSSRGYHIRPTEAGSDTPVLMQMTIPPGVKAEIRLDDSVVSVTGLRGDLTVQGQRIELSVRGLFGDVELDLDESTARLDGAEQDVRLDGSGLDVEISRVEGRVALTLDKSQMRVQRVGGDTELALEETSFFVEHVGGNLRLDAHGGSGELAFMEGGGQVRMDETKLKLRSCAGQLEVETNAALEFETNRGKLTIRSYDSTVNGTGSTGPVELHAEGGVVELTEIAASASVRADDTEVRILGAQGDLNLQLVSSNLLLQAATGAVVVDSEFGDVQIDHATQAVRVKSRDGEVRIQNLEGSLTLDADTREVDINWSKFSDNKTDSFIENKSGDVRLSFGEEAICVVEAQAPLGQVESTLDEIEVSQDGRRASGALHQARAPKVEVTSGRDVYIDVVDR